MTSKNNKLLSECTVEYSRWIDKEMHELPPPLSELGTGRRRWTLMCGVELKNNKNCEIINLRSPIR